MTRSRIASVQALDKVDAFLAALALRLTEPRSFGFGCGALGPFEVEWNRACEAGTMQSGVG